MCRLCEKMTSGHIELANETIDTLTNGELAKKKGEKSPMFPYERSMILKLVREWVRATDDALETLRRVIEAKASGDFLIDDLERLDTEFEKIFGERFGAVVRDDVHHYLEKSYEKGKREILKPTSVTFTLTGIDTQAIDWLKENNMYWVRSFYSRKLSGKIAGIVAEGMAQGLGRVEIGEMLEKSLTNYKGLGINPPSYWRGVASNAMNRSRNFGQVQAFADAYIETFSLVNPLDERTSSVCLDIVPRYQNVPIDVAVRQRDALIKTRDPEGVKEIAPFYRPDVIRGKARDQLMAMGVGLPPYHGKCRTGVVAG